VERRAIAGLWLVVTGSTGAACSSGVAVRDDAPPAPEPAVFAGQHYPAPEPLPATPPQPPPREPEPIDLPLPVPSANLTSADRDFAESVRNAATRDLETERLVRRYLAFVRAVVDSAGTRTTAQHGPTHDPLPMLRVHAGLLHELRHVVWSASVLQGRFHAIAADQAVDLHGDAGEAGRPGRLRQLYRMCGCIRRDAEERVAMGQSFVEQQRTAANDAQLRAAVDVPQQAAHDMALLTRTLECSRLVMRSFPADR
jgi:hypothetical protein